MNEYYKMKKDIEEKAKLLREKLEQEYIEDMRIEHDN